MKLFLTLCLTTLMIKAASAAQYEVPVPLELKLFATFELDYTIKHIEGNRISVSYILPEVLTGNTEVIRLEGELPVQGEEFLMTGPQGHAKCKGVSDEAVCFVQYDHLNIDVKKAKEAIDAISISSIEKRLRLEVMRSFSTDPVGILTY